MAIYLEDQLPGVKQNGLNTKKAVDFSGASSVALPSGTTINGATATPNTITSASASALVVGRQGTTDPVLKIDDSVASVVTGVAIQGQAATFAPTITAISTADTDLGITILGKGAGVVTLGAGTNGVTIGGSTGLTITVNTTISEAKNIVLGTTTGTIIGTATTQKLGFYNATPVVQPAASADITGFAAGVGTASKSDSTWTGVSGSSAYTVGGIVTRLKALGLLAA